MQVIAFSAVSMAERSAVIIVTLAAMGMGIVYLRMGKVSRVEVKLPFAFARRMLAELEQKD